MSELFAAKPSTGADFTVPKSYLRGALWVAALAVLVWLPKPAGAQDLSAADIGSFGIATGATDPAGETDGLDDRNEGFSRNFKYVSWVDVSEALGLE
jgi:hypothetical protein